MAPLYEVFARVIVVLPYAPGLAFSPVAMQCPPPKPEVLELSVLSVKLVKSEFDQLLHSAVLSPLKLVEDMRTTNASCMVVVAPGITADVSLVALSFPPAPIFQGSPDVITPEKQ